MYKANVNFVPEAWNEVLLKLKVQSDKSLKASTQVDFEFDSFFLRLFHQSFPPSEVWTREESHDKRFRVYEFNVPMQVKMVKKNKKGFNG